MSTLVIRNVFKCALVITFSIGVLPLEVATANTDSSTLNGRAVPADPGGDADITVAGVDNDRNGIRDEIDRYIAQKYGATENLYRAAQTYARASQRILVINSRDIDASRAAVLDKSDTGACSSTQVPNADNPTGAVAADITGRTFNSKPRLQQCKIVRNNAGFFSR